MRLLLLASAELLLQPQPLHKIRNKSLGTIKQ
jgi:hypothetical protein